MPSWEVRSLIPTVPQPQKLSCRKAGLEEQEACLVLASALYCFGLTLQFEFTEVTEHKCLIFASENKLCKINPEYSRMSDGSRTW